MTGNPEPPRFTTGIFAAAREHAPETPVTVPAKPGGITQPQATALLVLHGQLRRACPETAHLSFTEAGDLIVKLRAEVLDISERNESR